MPQVDSTFGQAVLGVANLLTYKGKFVLTRSTVCR